MPHWAAAILIVSGFLTVDAVIVAALMVGVGNMMAELVRAFPPQEPAADAVRRRFQSFQIGLVGCTWSIHVAADDRFLHLRPARIVRWFGVRPLSIPWDEIKVRGKGFFGFVRTTVRGVKIEGPAWCMGLASGGTNSPKR